MFYTEIVLREMGIRLIRGMSNSHHKIIFERVATLQTFTDPLKKLSGNKKISRLVCLSSNSVGEIELMMNL